MTDMVSRFNRWVPSQNVVGDWADNEALEVCFGGDTEEHRALIAAALRKAKADGMRECADWVQQIYGPDLANSFRETASKLSPT